MATRRRTPPPASSQVEASHVPAIDVIADELAAKTAPWGMDRVDMAMEPVLVEIGKLREQPSLMTIPRGDISTQQAMVKRAFLRLTLLPARLYGDHPRSADRTGRSWGLRRPVQMAVRPPSAATVAPVM
jgi:hypothetical protein